MSDVQHFEGTCDVCGETLMLDWDFAGPGTIDIGIDGDLVYTWRRHSAGAHLDCGRFFSRVYRKAGGEAQQTNP